MSFVEAFMPEFEHEMDGTRRIVELVPDAILDWKAHESLNTIRWVASHLADTLSWMELTLNDTSFDVAPVDGEPHQTPLLSSSQAILELFDTNLASAKAALSKTTDEGLFVPFSLLQGGKELFTMPRMAVVKTFMLNHVIHHRAFLVAYLRMNDVECPGLYD